MARRKAETPPTPQAAPLTIEYRAVGELYLDPANVRHHDERNLEAIQASLKAFGIRTPIVIRPDGKILKGNGTYRAAKALGIHEIPVVVAPLGDVDAVAYAIADNRTSDLSTFDDPALAAQLQMLLSADFDTQAAGFTQAEIDELMKSIGDEYLAGAEVTEDDVPEPTGEPPITKPGDVWLLGAHRLMCGDSTDEACVRRLMAGKQADMVLTDPPYGVSYVGKTKDALTIENDALDPNDLARFVAAAFDHAEAFTRPGSYWYMTVPAGPLHLIFADDWNRRGILRQIMVWVKDSLVMGHSEYHYQHEPILYGWKPGERHKNEDRTRTTVWAYARPKVSREHPTMKPVALWAQAINDGSRPGEIVYDPFSGSGTTIMAAEQLKRAGYGMEIDPGYCDVIVRRWEAYTGQKAALESAGETNHNNSRPLDPL